MLFTMIFKLILLQKMPDFGIKISKQIPFTMNAIIQKYSQGPLQILKYIFIDYLQDFEKKLKES